MFTLTIPAFADGAPIPIAYTCDGKNESPAVEWSGVPAEAQSLALVVEDPDVPKELGGEPFTHWLLYAIPPSAAGIPKGWPVGTLGVNSAGQAAYTGPCPPIQYEPREHRYVFTLYALDILPKFEASPAKDELVIAMQGHILAEASYNGRYARQ